MFRKHRAGVSLGFIIVALGGGFFGYVVGALNHSLVFGLQNQTSAEIAGAVTMAVFAGVVWSIGEAIVGLVGAAGRDATLVRLGVSLIGSFISVVTAGLSLLNVHLFGPADPHSIFAYGPLAGGMGSIALGAHALLHQIHLDKFEGR